MQILVTEELFARVVPGHTLPYDCAKSLFQAKSWTSLDFLTIKGNWMQVKTSLVAAS
jgi:hypothetical protein